MCCISVYYAAVYRWQTGSVISEFPRMFLLSELHSSWSSLLTQNTTQTFTNQITVHSASCVVFFVSILFSSELNLFFLIIIISGWWEPCSSAKEPAQPSPASALPSQNTRARTSPHVSRTHTTRLDVLLTFFTLCFRLLFFFFSL